ncbi:hypothetical protein B0H16DRAFT_1520163 [Mycena metata]|uniref:RNase III domain-containing protein n=1 Tax=Mycena metata TaxID=1033252 RepID=A0AAD7JNF9_9AGAR|nr:hypothetical protein B0H16DRAFT_1520163 [Mycena metata]
MLQRSSKEQAASTPSPTLQMACLAPPPPSPPLDAAPSLKRRLQQFDALPYWEALEVTCPVFSNNYPPALLPLPTAILPTVFAQGKNNDLEWLGDQLVACAVALTIHRIAQDPECRALRSAPIFRTLVSGRFLAHIGVMYGLHLKTANPTTPSMKGVGDLFEAYVGALAQHSGFQTALEWLDRILSAWVETFCADEKMVAAKNLTLSKSIKSRYLSWKRRAAGAPPVPLQPLILPPGAGTKGFRLCAPPDEDCRQLLAAGLPGWDTIDLAAVPLPERYPPIPPPFDAPDLPSLADALTDPLCRLEFLDVEANSAYRIIGEQVFLLALTALAIDKLPTATPAELEESRIECANPALVARLGAILNLHRHFRMLRLDEGDLAAPRITTDHLEGAFHTLLGVMHLRLGWDALFEWLERMLGPWVLAAGYGTLRASDAAEKKRRLRLQCAEKRRIKREEHLREGRERQRLAEERNKQVAMPMRMPKRRRGFNQSRSGGVFFF